MFSETVAGGDITISVYPRSEEESLLTATETCKGSVTGYGSGNNYFP